MGKVTIVDYEVTNKNDFSALASLSIKAKKALDLQPEDSITVLADKGYYSGEQIAKCHDNNIETLVAPKSKGSKSKDSRVTKDKFTYIKKSDHYICPKGIKLHRQGKLYKRHDGIPFKMYVGHWTECRNCPWVGICVSTGSQKASRGRMLNRNIYEDQMDENDIQVNVRKNEYRRRQAIVEHPFSTIKRQWGFSHTNLKSLKKVNGEFGLILLCYNLKRVLSIIGMKGLKNALINKKKTDYNDQKPNRACYEIYFSNPPETS
ncbi:MAG: transposase [Saprospiraceae bacterium]|nr:transposase [Saprospiraceae bacterium]